MVSGFHWDVYPWPVSSGAASFGRPPRDSLLALAGFYAFEAVAGAIVLAALWRLMRTDEGEFVLGMVFGILLMLGYSMMRYGDLNLLADNRRFVTFLACFVVGPVMLMTAAWMIRARP